MKKQVLVALLLICCMFASGLVGFFIGRNTHADPVYVSRFPTESADISDKLDINTATARQLQHLPGVGPVLAQRIVTYREANGPFQTVSELSKVDGIDLLILERIMDYIYAGGEQ